MIHICKYRDLNTILKTFWRYSQSWWNCGPHPAPLSWKLIRFCDKFRPNSTRLPSVLHALHIECVILEYCVWTPLQSSYNWRVNSVIIVLCDYTEFPPVTYSWNLIHSHYDYKDTDLSMSNMVTFSVHTVLYSLVPLYGIGRDFPHC
jgi:hypothetical protein